MTIGCSIISGLAHAAPGNRSGRLLILIYHRVRPELDPMFPNEIKAVEFNWQMSLLRRHCHPLRLNEAVRMLRQGSLPARAVAVTFDDGYADNAQVALPLLVRHGVPATFFVASGFLDGGRMWNDSVIESLRRCQGDSIDLAKFGLASQSLGDEASRGRVAESIIRAIKHLHPEQRNEKVAMICGFVGAPLPDDLMMTSEQVRSLTEAGMEVGAHTVNHPILRTLAASESLHEVEYNRRALESITGRRIFGFAYPNGRPGDDYSPRDRDIVASLGFEYAVSAVRGVASSSSDRYQLPRFAPWGRTPSRWFMRLLAEFSKV